MPVFCVESKEVLETNGKEGDGLRKRKISHLGSLDKTEADDDEEGEEEDFQPPQREEETVFSLNKCILAAVILLGLGTIFFSGEHEAPCFHTLELNQMKYRSLYSLDSLEIQFLAYSNNEIINVSF